MPIQTLAFIACIAEANFNFNFNSNTQPYLTPSIHTSLLHSPACVQVSSSPIMQAILY